MPKTKATRRSRATRKTTPRPPRPPLPGTLEVSRQLWWNPSGPRPSYVPLPDTRDTPTPPQEDEQNCEDAWKNERCTVFQVSYERGKHPEYLDDLNTSNNHPSAAVSSHVMYPYTLAPSFFLQPIQNIAFCGTGGESVRSHREDSWRVNGFGGGAYMQWLQSAYAIPSGHEQVVHPDSIHITLPSANSSVISHQGQEPLLNVLEVLHRLSLVNSDSPNHSSSTSPTSTTVSTPILTPIFPVHLPPVIALLESSVDVLSTSENDYVCGREGLFESEVASNRHACTTSDLLDACSLFGGD